VTATAPALPDEAEFTQSAIAFLEAVLTRKGVPRTHKRDAVERARSFQRQLFDEGFGAITWPIEYGGRDLPRRYQRAFDRVLAAYQTPPRVLDIGLGMIGPAILVHGTDEQKQRFVPPLLRGEHVWCELFSEPGAGSDLASAQMSATRDGDLWVLDGQKVWTSGAHHSDYAACIARTDRDQPKHEGISLFLVDMRAPGVTVRPLRQMTGDAHFNEVFLDGVRVHTDDVLGGVNGGWRVTRTILAFERQTLAVMGSGGGGGGGGFTSLVDAARERELLDRAEVRQQLIDLRIRQTVLRQLSTRLQFNAASGKGTGGEASLVKLAMASLLQDTADVAVALAGPAAVAWDPATPRGDRWTMQLLNAPSASIGGGTNEIVRNVIAERLLGLPRDIEVDADVPFHSLKVGTQRGD
jgi:alkylation response protein AidB-like acyl-CoA dehydrogenase